MDLWNGLVRGILNLSRDARGSTVKRIGYRTICSVSEEEAGLLTASNGGGTTTIESSSICAKFLRI